MLQADIPEREMSEIFNFLRKKGGFLCANHPDTSHKMLYDACLHHKEGLEKYFLPLGLKLIHEEDFFYFENRSEGDADSAEVEQKLKGFLPFINLYMVLVKILGHVGAGTIFRIADIEQSVLNNLSLSTRYKGKGKGVIRDEIEKDIRRFVREGYIWEISSQRGEYIILTSFERLNVFLREITIEGIEEVKDEMQQEIEMTEEENDQADQ